MIVCADRWWEKDKPEKRVCERCGCEFETTLTGQKYCDPCREKPIVYKAKRVVCRKCGKKFAVAHNRVSVIDTCIKCRLGYNHEGDTIIRKKLSIEEVVESAEAEGLSYGEWVAKHETLATKERNDADRLR